MRFFQRSLLRKTGGNQVKGREKEVQEEGGACTKTLQEEELRGLQEGEEQSAGQWAWSKWARGKSYRMRLEWVAGDGSLRVRRVVLGILIFILIAGKTIKGFLAGWHF